MNSIWNNLNTTSKRSVSKNRINILNSANGSRNENTPKNNENFLAEQNDGGFYIKQNYNQTDIPSQEDNIMTKYSSVQNNSCQNSQSNFEKLSEKVASKVTTKIASKSKAYLNPSTPVNHLNLQKENYQTKDKEMSRNNSLNGYLLRQHGDNSQNILKKTYFYKRKSKQNISLIPKVMNRGDQTFSNQASGNTSLNFGRSKRNKSLVRLI